MLKSTNPFGGFPTDNIDKAREFYQDTLGLKVTENEMGILELHTQGNNPIIIYSKTNHEPANFTVLNFPVKDIEAVVDMLIQKYVVFEQYDEPIKTDIKGIYTSDQGPKIAWFKDPAGNILSIIEE